MGLFYCLLCIGFSSCVGLSGGTEVTVQSPVGEIIGAVANAYSLFDVRRFYGIPYAEAPVGNLRFMKPVPKATFASAFNATALGPICHQKIIDNSTATFEQSEDCLRLNIYTPIDASPANKKAVMVFIHGGSFTLGSAYEYEGELLSGFGDVVLVIINYRIDVYGFLSTGDTSLPGNFGLWDQHLAIKWVHDNIEAFGGDASMVTVFGESAGSASVAYQTFYPGNMGLFQRAIAQSGGITDIWAIADDPSANFYTIALEVGCNRTNTAAIVECLRTVSNDKLMMAANALPVAIAPVFDSDFVVDHPKRLISGNTMATSAIEMFHSVDLLVGFTNADGLEVIPYWMSALEKDDFENFTVTRQEFEEIIVPLTIGQYYKIDGVVNNTAASRAVIEHYTDTSDLDDDVKLIKMLTNLATDMIFAVTPVNTADLHTMSPTRSTYAYKFSVKPIFRFIPIPAAFDGPDVMVHADDLIFVFGFGIENVAEPGNEMFNIYQATMTMWSNFAKSGNPNTPGDVKQYLNITWPEYGVTRNYVEIKKDPEPAKQNYNYQSATFWSRVLPRVLGICPDVNQLTEYVTVSTPVGEILGKEEFVPISRTCGYRVKKFLGIPYAESPSGDLRFKKPAAKAAFTGIFNATVEGATCYQSNLPMFNDIYPRSEDCLLLNVYAPHSAANIPDNKKAVMIWIHGGGFVFGQTNSYSDIGVLSGYGDVIVVTINYRLGMLGFLSTGDSSLPGNLGLWDQHTAIKWVHDNIHAFGGDSGRITLVGQQSGAASVIYQCFYPGNMGLFQRAIAQGGTSDNVWTYRDISKALEYTRAVEQNFSCSLQRTEGFVACLRGKSITDIERFMNENPDFPLPVRDNDFVQDTPYNLISGISTVRPAMEMFYSVDLLTGMNNFDGIVDIVLNGLQLPITEDELENTHMHHFLEMILGRQASPDVQMAVLHEYKDWKNPTSDQARALKVAELFTDAYFAVNTIRTADQHLNSAHNKSTFMYQFGVKPTRRYLPIPSTLDAVDVASNGDELDFVTGAGIQDAKDDKLGRQQFNTYTAIMNMWSNFAKTGNPNTPDNVTPLIQTTWPMYSSSRPYLDIKPEMTSAKSNLRSKAVNFWSNIIAESVRLTEERESCTTSGTYPMTSRLSAGTLFLMILALLCFQQ